MSLGVGDYVWDNYLTVDRYPRDKFPDMFFWFTIKFHFEIFLSETCITNVVFYNLRLNRLKPDILSGTLCKISVINH